MHAMSRPEGCSVARQTRRLFAMPLRLFCCDDDAAELVLLHQWLDTDDRFTIVGETYDVAIALQRLRVLQPDVIITDLLPGPSDATYLRRLKAAAPDSVLLVYSGYRDWQLADDVIAPADGFLTKAIDGEQLILALERLVADQGTDRPPT